MNDTSCLGSRALRLGAGLFLSLRRLFVLGFILFLALIVVESIPDQAFPNTSKQRLEFTFLFRMDKPGNTCHPCPLNFEDRGDSRR
jgi:hypothetical protein